MKIWFERSGGFTGIPLKATIDCDLLDSMERTVLCELAEAAEFFDLPDTMLSSQSGTDRFHYELTLQMEGRTHTIRFDDMEVSDALRQFTQRVTTLARGAR